MFSLQQVWLRAANAIEGTGRTVRTITPIAVIPALFAPDPSGLSQGLSIMFGAAAIIGGCAAVGIGKAMRGEKIMAPMIAPK